MQWSIITAAGLFGFAVSSPVLDIRQSASLNSFIASEEAIALDGALANIGGTSNSIVTSGGALPGIVVASPSTVNPNYFYTWTRDSALTYTMIIEELIFGNASFQKTVEDYTHAQAVLQTVTNPSGTLWPAGLGLAEPKFYTNETRFNGDWGRPQRDGPAIRATAFLTLSAALLKQNEASVVKEIYWPLIHNDLLYVGQYWNQSGYDLWEEVHGNSFFTMAYQHRALVEGNALASAIGETCEPCQQAPAILCFLQNNYWNETGGYLTADVNVNNVNRSGINTDPILGSIHVFDINATCDAGDFQPCNSKMLATHKVVVDSFRNLYPINHNATAPKAVAVGRYPEDTYYNGNPWYLTTLACAEMLYDAAAQIKNAGKLVIDQYSLPFFEDLECGAALGTYSGKALDRVLYALTNYADGFVEVIEQYTPPNGTLNEQINATTGEPTSAIALTWSFASFVTAARRRAGFYPPSWGAGSTFANTVPSTCPRSSYNATGQYQPASAAGAPNITEAACLSEIIFEVNATTMFGQNVYLVGNDSLLGGAVGNYGDIILPMNPGNYTSARAEWYIDIYLPSSEVVEYQYVLEQSDGSFTFENVTRTVTLGPCGMGVVVVTNDVSSFPPS